MRKIIHNLKLSQLLIASLLLVGIIPAQIVGLVATDSARDALREQSYNQLNTVRAIKSNQIASYFNEREGDIGVLTEIVSTLHDESSDKLTLLNSVLADEMAVYLEALKQELLVFSKSESVIKATAEFSRAYENQGKTSDAFLWQLADELYGQHIDDFTKQFGWYDAFILNLDGDILYTTARESDLGQGVDSSLIAGSGLEVAFNRAKTSQADHHEIYFGDFSPYKPSNNEPAGFFLTRIFDAYGNHIGYAALQFPIISLINEHKD